MLSRQKQVPTA
jgi:DNA-binding protein H-NS